MKKVARTIAKVLFFVSYPILVVCLVIAVTLLVVKMRELDAVNNTFRDATSQLNEENQNKQITIEDLKTEFNKLNQEITTLKAENASLKQSLDTTKQEGYGTISGKIYPVITSSTDGFSQYQKVCAISTKNKNIEICRTVSALQQTFNMSIPVGTYNVYAEIYPRSETSTLKDVKAYYTKYTECIQKNADNADACDAKKLGSPVEVKVEAGSNLVNIDPTDWR